MWFLLWTIGYLGACFYIFDVFFQIFFSSHFNLVPLQSQNTGVILGLLDMLVLVLCPEFSFGKCFICILKDWYSTLLNGVFYKSQLSQDSWLIVQVLHILLIFCLFTERSIEVSTSNCGFVYAFHFVSFCFTYFETLLLG